MNYFRTHCPERSVFFPLYIFSFFFIWMCLIIINSQPTILQHRHPASNFLSFLFFNHHFSSSAFLFLSFFFCFDFFLFTFFQKVINDLETLWSWIHSTQGQIFCSVNNRRIVLHTITLFFFFWTIFYFFYMRKSVNSNC